MAGEVDGGLTLEAIVFAVAPVLQVSVVGPNTLLPKIAVAWWCEVSNPPPTPAALGDPTELLRPEPERQRATTTVKVAFRSKLPAFGYGYLTMTHSLTLFMRY